MCQGGHLGDRPVAEPVPAGQAAPELADQAAPGQADQAAAPDPARKVFNLLN